MNPSMAGNDSDGARPARQGTELYRPFACRIEEVRTLTPSEKLFVVARMDGEAFVHEPGQFYQVSVTGIGEAPISASSSAARGRRLELGIRRVGVLTGAMHRMQPGDGIGLRGPFGSRFPVDAMEGKSLLLIAGGCGLAPMRSLIQHVQDTRDDFAAVTILCGAKTPDDLLYKDELRAWQRSQTLDCRVIVDAADEGSRWDGEVGLITSLIPPLQLDAGNTIAVVAGPPAMYRFVIDALLQKGMAAKHMVVTLERHMKCGVGKCGHCSIEHLFCCSDGPVFTVVQVMDIRGAL